MPNGAGQQRKGSWKADEDEQSHEFVTALNTLPPRMRVGGRTTAGHRIVSVPCSFMCRWNLTPKIRNRSADVASTLIELAHASSEQPGHTYDDIARVLGVSKSSVSLWVRDLPMPASRVVNREGWGTALPVDDATHVARHLWRKGRSRGSIQRALGLDSDRLIDALQEAADPGPSDVGRSGIHLRAAARLLRSAGWTHAEIAQELSISTSSSSLWTTDIGRSVDEIDGQLKPRQWNAMARGRADLRRQQQKLEAANSLPIMTADHLLVAAVVAYWCEGAKDKPYERRESLIFCNSDMRLIQLWTRFLDELSVTQDRRRYRLQIHESADVESARRYWADVLGVSPDRIRTSIKRHVGTSTRRNVGDAYHGCLSIYVCKGAELYRQVDGWFQGIIAGALRLGYKRTTAGA